jgi:hypothetical protein
MVNAPKHVAEGHDQTLGISKTFGQTAAEISFALEVPGVGQTRPQHH